MQFKANFQTSFIKDKPVKVYIRDQDLATTISPTKTKEGLVRYHNDCCYTKAKNEVYHVWHFKSKCAVASQRILQFV